MVFRLPLLHHIAVIHLLLSCINVSLISNDHGTIKGDILCIDFVFGLGHESFADFLAFLHGGTMGGCVDITAVLGQLVIVG